MSSDPVLYLPRSRNVNNSPAVRPEKAGFSRLGYRGIVITNPAGIEGIPATLQLHDGKVKIPGIRGEDAGFFRDTVKLEKLYLGLAKEMGLITELLNAQMIPDPGDM